MTKSSLLGAAAILAALIASPVLAQPAMQEPGAYAQYHPWANDYHYRYGRSGFWPGDPYAYYGGNAPYDDSYAYYIDRPVTRRTTCGPQPWATYMGPDGRWYPC